MTELTQKETENPFLYALPNSGDELKAILDSKNMEADAKNIGHKVGNKNIENDKNYAGLYRSIKYKILDSLASLGLRYNLYPERFCKLYDDKLKKALGQDCSGTMKSYYGGTVGYTFQGGSITLGEMMTRPFETKDEKGILRKNNLSGSSFLNGGNRVSHDKLFDKIKDSVSRYQDNENANIIERLNGILEADKKNGFIDKLRTSLCGNDENKKKIFDQLPIETMYRKYFVSHWNEGFEFNKATGDFEIKSEQNKTAILDGFKEYL